MPHCPLPARNNAQLLLDDRHAAEDVQREGEEDAVGAPSSITRGVTAAIALECAGIDTHWALAAPTLFRLAQYSEAPAAYGCVFIVQPVLQ